MKGSAPCSVQVGAAGFDFFRLVQLCLVFVLVCDTHLICWEVLGSEKASFFADRILKRLFGLLAFDNQGTGGSKTNCYYSQSVAL